MIASAIFTHSTLDQYFRNYSGHPIFQCVTRHPLYFKKKCDGNSAGLNTCIFFNMKSNSTHNAIDAIHGIDGIDGIDAFDTVEFGKALADETRQHIMKLCCCTRLTVSEITTRSGVSQSTASHHLSILRNAGLVHAEVEGRETYYSLNQAHFTVCCGRLMQQFAPQEKLTQSITKKLALR